MASDPAESDEVASSEVFEDFLLALGNAELAAGYPVNDVDASLAAVSRAYSREDINVLVLPSAVLLDDPRAARARVISDTGVTLRLDQAAVVHRVAREARTGALDPAEGLATLEALPALKPRFPTWASILGYGLAAGGFALVFRVSLWGVAMAFLCGLFVGVLQRSTLRRPALAPLVPPLAATVCAFAVFGFGSLIDADVQPLRVVAAPLITLIPGVALTRATAELATGHTISGASRLIASIMQILVLTFGILVGATLAQVSPYDLGDLTEEQLPLWVAWVGVLVYAIGQAVASNEPKGAVRYVIPLLLLAYGLQSLFSWLFNVVIAAGIAASLTLLVAIAIQRWGRLNVPSFVTFQPVFWLLVPGSLGLVAVAEAVAGGGDDSSAVAPAPLPFGGLVIDSSGSVILVAGATIIAITLGMQVASIAGRLIPERSS